MNRIPRSWIARMGFSAVLVASVLGVTAPPSSASGFTFPLGVVADSFRFLGVPAALPAAHYDVHFFNISREDDHELVAGDLGPACSSTTNTANDAQRLLAGAYQQAAAAGRRSPIPFLAASCPGLAFEGRVFAGPNFGRDEATFNLTAGKTLYFCGIPEPDGTQHFDLGMIGFVNVFSLPGF